MSSDPLYLQAVRGEREEQVARYRRERAGLRAAAGSYGTPDPRSAVARLLAAPLRLWPHRARRQADELPGAEAGTRRSAAS
ncbi:MAG TPA: hypothetical protein VFD32_14220 [Dehalococcoidia bacterium]|nr:hypothetical protein [Dehalococcoidia bacterium]